MRRAGLAAGLLAAGLWVGGCQAKAPRAEFRVPPQEASRVNPVAWNADSIAKGQEAYLNSDCAVCHGKSGNGRGFMAGASHFECRDWGDASSLKSFSDGDLFYILNKGKGKMPGYERRLDPQQGWLMITFVRSLAKQAP